MQKRIIKKVTYIDPNICFECGAPATEQHHIIPVVRGGTKTIPLCSACHAKVHDIKGRRDNHVDNTKIALERRKELIKTQGGFFSKSGKWCTRLGNLSIDKETLKRAQEAASRQRHEAKEEWLKNSEAYKFVWEMFTLGIDRQSILEELSRLYDIDPQVWGTRNGARVSKGILSKWLNPEKYRSKLDCTTSEPIKIEDNSLNKDATTNETDTVEEDLFNNEHTLSTPQNNTNISSKEKFHKYRNLLLHSLNYLINNNYVGVELPKEENGHIIINLLGKNTVIRWEEHTHNELLIRVWWGYKHNEYKPLTRDLYAKNLEVSCSGWVERKSKKCLQGKGEEHIFDVYSSRRSIVDLMNIPNATENYFKLEGKKFF